MPERIPEQITLEELENRLQRRTGKFTPDHIAGIQTRLQILGTDKGPAILNPANYKGLDKLRTTLRLGLAREKREETKGVLSQRASSVRETVADALTAVTAYQSVLNLQARGYLPGVDPEEFNQVVTEAVGKVYKGSIIFPESQPIQKPQPEFRPKPAEVSEFRLQSLQSLDRFRPGSKPYELLDIISRSADGLTRDELLRQVFAGDSKKASQLFAAIAHGNEKLLEDGIQIISRKDPDGHLVYVIVSADQKIPGSKRKKKGEVS